MAVTYVEQKRVKDLVHGHLCILKEPNNHFLLESQMNIETVQRDFK